MADYANRTDLQNSATSSARYTGQTYGQGAAQERSQQMISPGRPPTEVQAQRVRPGGLTGPTQRPAEPITAGAPFGPGARPMQAGMPRVLLPDSSLRDKLLALYDIYPSDRLRMQIQRMIGYDL